LQVIGEWWRGEFAGFDQLTAMNLFGVIVGKAFYEGRISLEELATFSKESAC
jgi:phosphoribosylformimino-5-aminoimidazole carboxamide ribotide isomerase